LSKRTSFREIHFEIVEFAGNQYLQCGACLEIFRADNLKVLEINQVILDEMMNAGELQGGG
jgi:hypothetical protein